MLPDFLIIFCAYLIGSIPSGLLIARLNGIDDIRSYGSGNIGATNVSRVLGYKYFIIVLCADSLKSFWYLALLGRYQYPLETLALCAAALFLGNGMSLFLKFGGGKGVATLVGILAYLSPQVLIYMIIVWAIALAVTQTVGIASVISFIILPFLMAYVSQTAPLIIFACFASVLGIFFHRDNISKAVSYAAKS